MTPSDRALLQEARDQMQPRSFGQAPPDRAAIVRLTMSIDARLSEPESDEVAALRKEAQEHCQAVDEENFHLRRRAESAEHDLAAARAELAQLRSQESKYMLSADGTLHRYGDVHPGARAACDALYATHSPSPDQRGETQPEVGEPWVNVPAHYQGTWAYEFDAERKPYPVFRVYCNGYEIASAEDSEVAHAICVSFNTTHPATLPELREAAARHGMVMVPREPTQIMKDAAYLDWYGPAPLAHPPVFNAEELSSVYRAMIAAGERHE